MGVVIEKWQDKYLNAIKSIIVYIDTQTVDVSYFQVIQYYVKDLYLVTF